MNELDSKILLEKKDKLENILSAYERLAIAFSGGTDSSFLLYETAKSLGRRNVIAIMARSPFLQKKDYLDAIEFCEKYRIKFIEVIIPYYEYPEILENPYDRCYFCKELMFTKISDAALKEGFITVADGTNFSDLNEYRPGLKILKKLEIQNPFVIAGLNKEDIRNLARKSGLRIYSKPSSSCLATKIPYGEKITIEKLKLILDSLGIKKRSIRCCEIEDGLKAVLELDQNGLKILNSNDNFSIITSTLKNLGFKEVEISKKPYISGLSDKKQLGEAKIKEEINKQKALHLEKPQARSKTISGFNEITKLFDIKEEIEKEKKENVQ